MADTAYDFAKFGGVMDKKTANDIINTSGKVIDRYLKRQVDILMYEQTDTINDSFLYIIFLLGEETSSSDCSCCKNSL